MVEYLGHSVKYAIFSAPVVPSVIALSVSSNSFSSVIFFKLELRCSKTQIRYFNFKIGISFVITCSILDASGSLTHVISKMDHKFKKPFSKPLLEIALLCNFRIFCNSGMDCLEVLYSLLITTFASSPVRV